MPARFGSPPGARSHLAGAGFPPGGACPAGAKTISFSAEKETVLDSKEKWGRSTGHIRAKTAASGFRMTGRTPSGRYGLPLGNRDSLRSVYPPPAGASLTAGVVWCFPCGGGGDARAGLSFVGHDDPARHTALCRESGTARRPPDRIKNPSLFHYGMAVTAGAGPHHSA